MDRDTLTLVIAIIGSSGLGATIVSFYKAKPEASKMMMDAAQGAVVIATGTVDILHAEIARVRTDAAADITRVRAEHSDCEERLRKLEIAFEAIDERKRGNAP